MEERVTVNLKTKLSLLSISLVIVFLDQITKRMIMNSMYYHETWNLVGDFLRFTYIRNPNSVFGLHFGGPSISTALTVLAFIFVIVLYVMAEKPLFTVALSMIMGGAVGNLVDRILYMEVIDFIDVGINKIRWPTFNVADSFVTIGIVIVITHWFIENKHDNSSSDTV